MLELRNARMESSNVRKNKGIEEGENWRWRIHLDGRIAKQMN